jgi:hypothetical protein
MAFLQHCLGGDQLNPKFLQGALLASCLALVACSRQTAEEKGKAMATEKIDIVTGVGRALEEKGAKAGESVAGGVGTVLNGVKRGVLKSGRTITLDPSVTTAGIKITKVQDAGRKAGEQVHALEAYVVADAAVAGTLRVTMFDAMDSEIGRISTRLIRASEEGKYEKLALSSQIDMSSISKVVFVFNPDSAEHKSGTAYASK